MPSITPITLYGPPVLIALALIWGFGRILYLRRTAGVSVLAVLGRKRNPVEAGAGVVALVLNLYMIARPFWPSLDDRLMVQPFAYAHWGVLLMAIGILIAMISQMDMGRSWRIGLPEELEEDQPLITGGLYQFSRNPIYVGIMLFLLGSVVVAPGPVTIASLVLSWIFISLIIRAEEDFLAREFGEAFDAYKARVRRWL
ncbi:methyltransferase family protein [Kordiimonas lacus]|uniref:Protein-S-isoprenylcysteine O-methyltransferase Ste14 n=1 Tax=Kordiimonas lacus TaxID=637679 RepID=A0A1G6Y3K7_9PROT|nr:isoprenylcysteine carboxylmethyltransferase family protein [Kordiimonas lacus]SDD84930.1 Protein-S-isoprenylcysteine O-methyltransferase Ste14 [Kordiimonas lacus]